MGPDSEGTATKESAPGPVRPAERIEAIDVVRGVAVLGILLMNIEFFGMPNNGRIDVLDARSPYDPDRMSWWIISVLFEGKMRALFSMLFGAGAYLLISRAERRGASAEVADIYYRRTLWLLAIGLFHAYVLSQGDILYDYALCGLFLYPLRKLSPRVLIAAGVIMLALLVPKLIVESRHLAEVRDKADAARVAEARGKRLDKEQRKAREEWAEQLKDARPTPDDIAEDIADHRGSYGKLFLKRAEAVVKSQTTGFYLDGFWDAGGMMLIGMGLMKLGVMSGSLPSRIYMAMAVFGMGLGLPFFAIMVRSNVRSRFDPVLMPLNETLYIPGRLAMAIGFLGLIVWIVKAGLFPAATARLAAVGRMALTNYVAASVICTTLFYGYGFGLYGQLRRYQLLYVVFAVWAIQILISPIWLRHFLYGPMEWLWRSLTYVKWQPMRLRSRRAEG